MSGGLEERLVSPSDIADLAGVSRGAVSNWRKRNASFPAPVAGTPSKPLFSLRQVSAWLEEHAGRTGNPGLVSSDRERGGLQLWSALNSVRESLPPDQASVLVVDLAVERHRGRASDGAHGSIDPEVVERLRAAIDQIDQVDLADSVDYALERLARWQGKAGADSGFVGSRTTALLADLASRMVGGVLYDPACGIAAALLEAVHRGARPERIVGHDISEQVIHIARGRAELREVRAEFAVTDVLARDEHPDLLADVIVLEPPFGLRFEAAGRLTDPRFDFGAPPTASADTAWMQHAVAHLSRGGRAYLLTPVAVLSSGGDEGGVRAELLRRGCVEAVVGLPGKLLPHTTMPLVLWVLRRPVRDAEGGRILIIDATEAASPEGSVGRWLADPASRGEVPHVDVEIAEVLATGSDLSPRRWVDRQAPEPQQVAADHAEGWSTIRAAVESLHVPLPVPDPFERLSEVRVLRVADLVERGVLDLRVGHVPDRRAAGSEPAGRRVTTSADLRAGILQAGGPEATDDPDATRPGDVLATMSQPIRARVDDTGGRLLSAGVCRLRICDPIVLSPGYLALVLSGGWNERFQSGTTPRVRVKDLEVPLLPIAEQGQIEQLAAAMEALRDISERLDSGASLVLTSLLDSVRYHQPLRG